VGGGELGGFGGVLGERVHGEGEVAEDEAEVVTKVVLEFLDEGEGVAAGGALVVTVLDEGGGRGGGALGVVFGGDGDG